MSRLPCIPDVWHLCLDDLGLGLSHLGNVARVKISRLLLMHIFRLSHSQKSAALLLYNFVVLATAQRTRGLRNGSTQTLSPYHTLWAEVELYSAAWCDRHWSLAVLGQMSGANLGIRLGKSRLSSWVVVNPVIRI